MENESVVTKPVDYELLRKYLKVAISSVLAMERTGLWVKKYCAKCGLSLSEFSYSRDCYGITLPNIFGNTEHFWAVTLLSGECINVKCPCGYTTLTTTCNDFDPKNPLPNRCYSKFGHYQLDESIVEPMYAEEVEKALQQYDKQYNKLNGQQN